MHEPTPGQVFDNSHRWVPMSCLKSKTVPFPLRSKCIRCSETIWLKHTESEWETSGVTEPCHIITHYTQHEDGTIHGWHHSFEEGLDHARALNARTARSFNVRAIDWDAFERALSDDVEDKWN